MIYNAAGYEITSDTGSKVKYTKQPGDLCFLSYDINSQATPMTGDPL